MAPMVRCQPPEGSFSCPGNSWPSRSRGVGHPGQAPVNTGSSFGEDTWKTLLPACVAVGAVGGGCLR